ncbi:ABC-three component system middle component 5 [Halomonas casei]|uniref:ABC-three component system middle component 5 n=1 Tax=Halomonas casei TaxID=2742613 RepID=UPI00299F8EBF|nr:ABC-three component system middle component 5 [Halomonas casei]
MLLILESSDIESFDWDVFRMLDYYVLFPHLLKRIDPFPAALRAYKKILKEIPEAYEVLQNDKRIFFELEAIQNTSIQNLMAKDLVCPEKLKDRIVEKSGNAIPGQILDAIKKDETANQEWFRCVVNELPLIEFDGKKGLKARSQLMEYRYDG